MAESPELPVVWVGSVDEVAVVDVAELPDVWVASVEEPPDWAEISAFRLSLENCWLGACRLASSWESRDESDEDDDEPSVALVLVESCPAEEVAWVVWAFWALVDVKD